MSDRQPSESVNSESPNQPELAIDFEAANRHLENLELYPISKRICICGHTQNAHHFSPEYGVSCRPSNIWCRCQALMIVYVASDARCFSRSTHGHGLAHALGMGVADLLRKGKTGQWLVDLKCWMPGCPNRDVSVACLDERGRLSLTSTEHSGFYCLAHIFEVGGKVLRERYFSP